MKEKIKNNYIIIIVLMIALLLHILAVAQLGFKYSINSDDLSYINSGIIFFETGKITMHGVLSAQIMPGLTFLIAFFCTIFGTGSLLILALKVLWIAMGIGTILVLYKIIKLFTNNQFIAAIPCLFLLAPDFVWMNNLILTETPFLLSFMLLIYYSLKFLKEQSNKSYIMIIIFYIICLFIRPTIGLYPIFLAIILLWKKYSFKELLKKGLIAGIVLILCLTPWIYRNYKVFNKFIPLTYGMGNPLLLGTYQGYGYPSDESLDYTKNVDEKMSEEMAYYMKEDTKRDHFKVYYLLKYDEMKAKYRMSEWWKTNKESMIRSYLFHKTKIMIYSSFYWEELFNIPETFNLLLRKIDIILFAISSLAILINKKYLKEFMLLMFLYGYHIIMYDYSFAYSRYAQTLFPIRFIIIGIGITIIYNKIRGKKNESINNYSSL